MNSLLSLVTVVFALGANDEYLAVAKKLQRPIMVQKYLDNTTFYSYQTLLQDIEKERPFYAVLIVQQRYTNDARLDTIYRYAAPKVIITKDKAFFYRLQFNSDILNVIILDQEEDLKVLKIAAQLLQYMRQSRILIVALNVKNRDISRAKLLQQCHTYKMTNVLLNFYDTQHPNSTYYSLYALQPYPQYHWKLWQRLENGSSGVKFYYPDHWLDMHNTSIVTIADNIPPNSLVFEDAQGKLKINGLVAQLIMLFAERYNASLKMHQSLKQLDNLHFITINEMVDDNVVDIPMVMSPINGDSWLTASYVYEVGSGMLMVPCAQSLNTREMFGVLLNVYFWGRIFIAIGLLSVMHSLIEYMFSGLVNVVNLLLSDKMFPGVLGQSFVARNLPSHSLKLLYLLVFIVGLNTSTKFAANIKTLFTSPPYHTQIQTFDDLLNFKLKILIFAPELPIVHDAIQPFAKSVVLTHNATSYIKARSNFNTSYGYIVPSNIWTIFALNQQDFTHKIFCTFNGLTLFDLVPWTIKLQQNSPYKEPLDDIIHRVHEMGLMNVWYSSTFSDMLKLKKVSLTDPEPNKGAHVLNVNDLYSVWMIVVGGSGISLMAFLLELLLGYRLRLFVN